MKDTEPVVATKRPGIRRGWWIRRILIAAGGLLLGGWAILGYLEKRWVLEVQEEQLAVIAQEEESLERLTQVAQHRAVVELSKGVFLSRVSSVALAELDKDDLRQLAGNYLNQLQDPLKSHRLLALNNVVFLVKENQPHLDRVAPQLVEQATPWLHDADRELAWHAIHALQWLEWRSKPAWPALMEIAADLENPLSPKANAALVQIDPESEHIPYPHLAVVGNIGWETFQRHLPPSEAQQSSDEELKAVLERIEADEKRRM